MLCYSAVWQFFTCKKIRYLIQYFVLWQILPDDFTEILHLYGLHQIIVHSAFQEAFADTGDGIYRRTNLVRHVGQELGFHPVLFLGTVALLIICFALLTRK